MFNMAVCCYMCTYIPTVTAATGGLKMPLNVFLMSTVSSISPAPNPDTSRRTLFTKTSAGVSCSSGFSTGTYTDVALLPPVLLLLLLRGNCLVSTTSSFLTLLLLAPGPLLLLLLLLLPPILLLNCCHVRDRDHPVPRNTVKITGNKKTAKRLATNTMSLATNTVNTWHKYSQ